MESVQENSYLLVHEVMLRGEGHEHVLLLSASIKHFVLFEHDALSR